MNGGGGFWTFEVFEGDQPDLDTGPVPIMYTWLNPFLNELIRKFSIVKKY